MKNQKEVRNLLEELCLNCLRKSPSNDQVAAGIAVAILETFGQELAKLRIEESKPARARALFALRMLLKIERIQREILVGHQPFQYPQTKAVLWRALCVGCFTTPRKGTSLLLSRALLRTRNVLKRGDVSEGELLEKIIRDAAIWCPFERIKTVLKNVRQESNFMVTRVMAHALIKGASPADIAKFANT